jgi:hypothetical protein
VTRWTHFYEQIVPENIKDNWLKNRIMRMVMLRPELYPLVFKLEEDDEKWRTFLKHLEKMNLQNGD